MPVLDPDRIQPKSAQEGNRPGFPNDGPHAAPKPVVASVAKAPVAEDRLSLPLYIAGLIVALTGITAINAEIGNPQFSSATVLLTILGFVFSYAYRWMRLNPRYLHYFALFLAAVAGYTYFTGSFNIYALMPAGSDLPTDLTMAVFLEWILVIRSWMLLGDGEVAFSAVFSVSIIGLVSVYDIDSTVVIDFLVYVVASIFLLIHQNYLVQRSWSGPLERRRPIRRVIEAQLAIAAVCGLLVLILGSIVVVPIAAVGSHLSLGGALKGLLFAYKDSKSGGDTSTGSEVAFSDDPNFAIGTGDASDGSDTTVLLHVDPSDHQPRYWRGRSYDHYAGNAWVSTLTSANEPTGAVPTELVMGSRRRLPAAMFTLNSAGEPGGNGALPPAVRSGNWSPLVTSWVHIVNGRTNTLYTPEYPHQIILPMIRADDFIQTQDGQLTDSEVDNGFFYVVTSYGGTPTPQELRSARVTNCSTDIRADYIDQRGDNVSDNDRSRLLTTAQDIVDSLPPAKRDEFDEAEQIRSWVSQRCVYSLSVSQIPSGQDSVSYFLFNSRKGYCDLFASSMAILCRYAGLPARVVTGFDQGVDSSLGGFDLRAMDKHAWVEVFFPGYGWYPFDPTDGSRTDSSVQNAQQQASSPYASLLSWLKSQLSLNGPVPIVLFFVIVISLAFILKTEVADPMIARYLGHSKERRLLLSGTLADGDAQMVWNWVRTANGDRYRRMERMLTQAGLPRPVSWTPREYESYLRGHLPKALSDGDPAGAAERAKTALESVAVLTEDFVLSRYAPEQAVSERLLESERKGLGELALAKLASATRRARFGGFVRRLIRRATAKDGSAQPSGA